MEPGKYFEGRRSSYKEKASYKESIVDHEDQFIDDIETEEEEVGNGGDQMSSFTESDKKKKGISISSRRGGSPPCCQAQDCGSNLSEAKQYHRRHKVCEFHSKALVVIVGGLRQRFCQQCSRFHEVTEFDEAKRSCRRRLQGHNERRRKSSAEYHAGEGSNRRASILQSKEGPCRQVDDQRGRLQIAPTGNPNYKHFHIR